MGSVLIVINLNVMRLIIILKDIKASASFSLSDICAVLYIYLKMKQNILYDEQNPTTKLKAYFRNNVFTVKISK